MKKRNIFVVIIIVLSLLIGGGLFVYNNTTKMGRKDTITLVKKIFRINIQDYEFEYENELKKNKYDGSLIVKLNLNADQLKEFLKKWEVLKSGFHFSTWPDDSDYITVASKRLGLDVKEGELYGRITGVRRKVRSLSEPRSVMSFVYFLENDDSSTTIYLSYAE